MHLEEDGPPIDPCVSPSSQMSQLFLLCCWCYGCHYVVDSSSLLSLSLPPSLLPTCEDPRQTQEKGVTRLTLRDWCNANFKTQFNLKRASSATGRDPAGSYPALLFVDPILGFLTYQPENWAANKNESGMSLLPLRVWATRTCRFAAFSRSPTQGLA